MCMASIKQLFFSNLLHEAFSSEGEPFEAAKPPQAFII